MKGEGRRDEGTLGNGNARYTQAGVESIPLVLLLLVFSVVGYFYAPSPWWIVIFVFGSLSVFIDRVYYRKTLELGDRLRRR